MTTVAGLRAGSIVTHPDRIIHSEGRAELGTVIADPRRYAWALNDLTREAPDNGMVKVRWHDNYDPATLHWEYAAELSAAPAGDNPSPIDRKQNV